MLNDDEAVFGELKGGDEEAADETEDEDVALHDGVVKKYNEDGKAGLLGRSLSLQLSLPLRLPIFVVGYAHQTMFSFEFAALP